MTPSVAATSVSADATPLKARWKTFRDANPNVRIRDAAHTLGVSEAELVATGYGETATRLNGEVRDLILELPKLGPVMALTRNESAVHEKTGCFGNIDLSGHAGLVLNEDIDLRLFLNQWRIGFAVTEQVRSGTRRSFQFFDAHGTAVHKIYLVEDSDTATYDRLRDTFAAPNEAIHIAPMKPKAQPKPDSEIDVAAFRKAWLGLQDTHDFFGLLHTYKLTRTQGLRLGGSNLAHRVSPRALRVTLELAAERDVPIMVFVGNAGIIQIHTGPVRNLKATGPWFNVLDDGFNLHLREDHIDSAWVVRKPTRDGVVTSLELYDVAGDSIATLFGKRKPGLPELDEWRALVTDLPALEHKIQ